MLEAYYFSGLSKTYTNLYTITGITIIKNGLITMKVSINELPLQFELLKDNSAYLSTMGPRKGGNLINTAIAINIERSFIDFSE
jgi:hypothetical protein